VTIESVIAIGIVGLGIVLIVAIIYRMDVKAKIKFGAHEAEFGATQTLNTAAAKLKKVRRKP
jgi:hypothetical protein